MARHTAHGKPLNPSLLLLPFMRAQGSGLMHFNLFTQVTIVKVGSGNKFGTPPCSLNMNAHTRHPEQASNSFFSITEMTYCIKDFSHFKTHKQEIKNMDIYVQSSPYPTGFWQIYPTY